MKKQNHLLIFVLAACMAHATARPSRALKQTFNMPLVVAETTMTGNQSSSEVTCRAEPLCLTEVCNPDAYKYELASAGKDFPYSVSYTTTSDTVTTTFNFMVCSTKIDCASADPSCSPLSNFQLRIKNSMVENGQSLLSSPKGSNWASCKPQGLGFKWTAEALGSLGAGTPPTEKTCETMSLQLLGGGADKATLADLCEQGVSIIDNQGETILETEGTVSCLFTLDTAAGRSAYGVLVDENAVVNEEVTATAYGASRRRRRLRTASNGHRMF